jgi:hypothetical protein
MSAHAFIKTSHSGPQIDHGLAGAVRCSMSEMTVTLIVDRNRKSSTELVATRTRST